jgi:glutaredoxin 3
MLTLIIAHPCPFCVRVTDFIKEHNITSVHIHDTQWNQDEHNALREKYGKSQVPVLLINDSPLFESLAIIKYLGENEL